MLEEIFWGVGAGISSVFLLRLILIQIGWLKAPVLRQMRTYGSPFHVYYALPALLAWMGFFTVCAGSLLMAAARLPYPAFVPGIILWLAAFFSAQSYHLFIDKVGWLQPDWAKRLAERVDYDEQRRVAWAWLRLPVGLRRRLSLSDKLFANWADLIILSVGSAQADTFVYAVNYRTLKVRTVSA